MGKLFELKKYYKHEGLIQSLIHLYWLVSAKISYKLNERKERRKWEQIPVDTSKRVFVIGNGPSLNITPLHLLDQEQTICFNRFTLFLDRIQWNPTMYMIMDGLVGKDIIEDIKTMVDRTQVSFVPAFVPKYRVNFKKHIKSEKVRWVYQRGKKIELADPPYVNVSNSVAVTALRILIKLGFKEIYLIGMDMNYQIHKTASTLKNNDIQSVKNDDPNHFDPRYFGKGKKYHQPNEEVVQRIFNSLTEIGTLADKYGSQIRNATLGGMLEVFPRIDLRSLFPEFEAEEFVKLQELIKFRAGFELESADHWDSIPQVDSIDAVSEHLEMFRVDTELTHSFLNKFIFDYNLFGPFRHQKLFIKRKQNG
ncbi:hypothetical protein Clim_1898 [Chlorobium limicola DSM 245]|uniref:6-hydroxymethylpterin diphosphokinase MptE-like domain-containing protein n=1 Tax=Chlorobium limicola (strain DSM 245 / NBRC 103803 / 6330) TaxID=290315 RepID=B3EF69_CHLL2|nr:6-hydroxymethylpterin diphosphokinase MptE-like protein [Chlorobium limicola]ACD90931.1 hypothetical protein Clim_1898 [Chlorobium limicola DSM 245]